MFVMVIISRATPGLPARGELEHWLAYATASYLAFRDRDMGLGARGDRIREKKRRISER
jgi:hypothetical protein